MDKLLDHLLAWGALYLFIGLIYTLGVSSMLYTFRDIIKLVAPARTYLLMIVAWPMMLWDIWVREHKMGEDEQEENVFD